MGGEGIHLSCLFSYFCSNFLGMKVKTSIALSSPVLEMLDRLAVTYKNRSTIIEEALTTYFAKRKKDQRDKKDLAILAKKNRTLNEEAKDVLTYQIDL